jgi:hypothetical protein
VALHGPNTSAISVNSAISDSFGNALTQAIASSAHT